MTIREAAPQDAEAIARVHVDTWRDAYGGIVPDSILGALSYESRKRDWEKRIGVAETTVLVADVDGEVAGFGACGPTRFPLDGYAGEIYALYVDPQSQGTGVGEKLFAALRERLRAAGLERCTLWVFEDNVDGCSFYEKLGGRRLDQRSTEMAGQAVIELAYGFGPHEAE